MDPKNKFTAETVVQLKQLLDEVAPHQATELSKQQAIRALSPQILSLRAKGYSWTHVAAMLTERGVPVSVAALRTYLRRVREEAASERSRAPTRRSREGHAVARQQQPQSVVSSPSKNEASPTGKPQPSSAASTPPAETQHASAGPPRREQDPRRSTFTVRPDTKDF
jgi:hypothetical protein